MINILRRPLPKAFVLFLLALFPLHAQKSLAPTGVLIYIFRKPPGDWLKNHRLIGLSMEDALQVLPFKLKREILEKSMVQGFPILLRDTLLTKIVTNFHLMKENRRKFLEISRKIP